MKKIQEFIQGFIDISSPDPDDMRRRKNLNIIILGLSFLLLIEIPISIFNLTDLEEIDNLSITIGSFFMLLSMIVIYYVNRHKAGSVSAYIFLAAITLVITLSDTPAQLANGRSLFIFIIPIVIAGMILEANSTFIFAAIGSLIISALSISVGEFPNTPAILSYFLVALLSWLSSNSLQQTLRDLRSINANLDKIVIERTNELANALSRERIESGRNQAILNSIADGVIVFNSNFQSILANPALSRLTNTNMQNLIGIDANNFFRVDQIPRSDQEMLMELISHPENSSSTLRIDWGKNTFSTSIAPVRTSDNEHIGTVTVFRDITQETLVEKMKDNFVALVSHELRTPLNAIMGHAEILKEAVYGPLNEDQLSITKRIMVNVNRLLAMVGDLLDEAQMRAGKLSIHPQVVMTASLLENLHGAMDRVANAKGLSIVSKINSGMAEQMIGDPQRIQQILVNLVGNAIKFTEQGSIEVNIDQVDSVDWKVEVTDHGIGIPDDELPYIFDSFRQANNLEFATRRHGGFGLGLSIVKQLIELMQGEISVKSEQGKGSTFTVTLPLTTMIKQERI